MKKIIFIIILIILAYMVGYFTPQFIRKVESTVDNSSVNLNESEVTNIEADKDLSNNVNEISGNVDVNTVNNEEIVENKVNNNLKGDSQKNKEDEYIPYGENEASIKRQLIENERWYPREVTSKGKDIFLEYYGSGVHSSNDGMVFKEDNTFTCYIGIGGENLNDDRGRYKIDYLNRKITLEYGNGQTSEITYKLNVSNGIMSFTEVKSDDYYETVNIVFEPKEKPNTYQIDLLKSKLINNDWKIKAIGTETEHVGKILTLKEDGTFYYEVGSRLGNEKTGKYTLIPSNRNQITLTYDDGITFDILFALMNDDGEIYKIKMNNEYYQTYELVPVE